MYEEIHSIKKYDHENLVPLYGVSTTITDFCLVHPWYKNGNVMGYLEGNPKINRFDLVSVFQKTP